MLLDTRRSGFDAAPVLQSAEHELDAIATPVTTLFVFDGLEPGLAA
jgi:hypothetical protein